MSPYDQHAAACRCEWGIRGVDELAPAEVIVVVDVLSFSTCVDVAVSCGVEILPCRWKDDSAAAFAETHRAELAGPRGGRGISLSPASFLAAEAGRRCVLPSPNGATLTLHAAAKSALVLTGCLRNARAVAAAAARSGATFNVIPAGERWPDGSLRPALEDWIAAGAILSELPGTKSPEASAAIAAFAAAMRHGLRETIAGSSSGRELIERGFAEDVELASAWNVSAAAPRFNGLAFVRHEDSPHHTPTSIASAG